jgi:hypothetical protein
MRDATVLTPFTFARATLACHCKQVPRLLWTAGAPVEGPKLGGLYGVSACNYVNFNTVYDSKTDATKRKHVPRLFVIIPVSHALSA